VALAEVLARVFGVTAGAVRADRAEEADVVLADEARRFAPAVRQALRFRRRAGPDLRPVDVAVDESRGDGDDEAGERGDRRPAEDLQPGAPAAAGEGGCDARQFDCRAILGVGYCLSLSISSSHR
jgi:hypothetical protein